MSDDRLDDAIFDDESRDEEHAPAWLETFRDERLLEIGSYTVASGGIVHLVGAGPGDPGLLTVRARQLLDRCDAIVHDALTHPAMLLRSDPTRAPAELHFVGKRGGDERSARQEDINELLVRLAREGKRVVRLKGGDPFVFGRGSEEAQALAEAGVPFDVVPGVTSGVAAPAYAGIPVTHRGLSTSVTLVTGHESPDKSDSQTDWAALARSGGTIVLYMGVRRLPEIAAALTAGGMPGEIPAAAIEWGTWPRQRTVVATLDTLADEMERAGIAAPVITVIGWTVVLRDEIAWLEQRPLHGRRVVVTRPANSSALAARLAELGAEVHEVPATRLERLDAEPLREAMQWLDSYEWVVFTSQNAVRYFWEELRAAERDARALAGCKLAVVGPATGDALLARGLAVDVMAERFVAEGVLEALAGRDDVAGARVLYVTAEGAREVLRDGLEDMGAIVEMMPLYRSVPDPEAAAPLRELVERGEADIVTFTSASTVRAFVDAVGAELAVRVPAVSIGPVTSDAAREAGLDVRAEAREATIAALTDAVVEAAGTMPGSGR
ncbi:MAG TPA: uroporphyrinogen-III C-methyltransferase [Gemmatimonadales bacterium]